MDYNDDMINTETDIDEKEWFYIVRIGTNERWCNETSINVCERYHLRYILRRLNQRYADPIWEAISVADYNRKFRNVNN